VCFRNLVTISHENTE